MKFLTPISYETVLLPKQSAPQLGLTKLNEEQKQKRDDVVIYSEYVNQAEERRRRKATKYVRQGPEKRFYTRGGSDKSANLQKKS